MNSENASDKPKRFRNFATIVYPESAPDGWVDALSGFHVPAFISPLHDKDVLPTGELKKDHYHVMIMFDGMKTLDQANEIISFIGGVGCEVLHSIRGYARYLCHLDDPDKSQYVIDDVKSLSGSDYFGVINLPVDKYKAINEMCDFCLENNIFMFADLMDYCRSKRFDWFRVLCDSSTYVMKNYLRSLEYKSQGFSQDKILDED